MKSSQLRIFTLVLGLLALVAGMGILVTSIMYQTIYSGNYSLNLDTWDCSSPELESKDFCLSGNPPFCRANTAGECFETNGTHDYFWFGSFALDTSAKDSASVTIVPKDINSIFLEVDQISLVALSWVSRGHQSLQIIVSGDVIVSIDENTQDIVNRSVVVKSKELQPNITVVLGPYDFGTPTIVTIKDVTIIFTTPTWCWVVIIALIAISMVAIILDPLKFRCQPHRKYQLMNEGDKRTIVVNP